MAGLDGTITIATMRRRAEFNVPLYVANAMHIPEGPTPCYVLGIFQSLDGDWAGPVAVCEMYDGRVAEVASDRVKFLDTKKGLLVE